MLLSALKKQQGENSQASKDLSSVFDPMGHDETLFGHGAEDDEARARELGEQKSHSFDDLKAPTLKDIKPADYKWLNNYVAQTTGNEPDVGFKGLNTQTAKAAELNGTAYDQIGSDPRLKDAQLGALSKMQELASQGGMNAADTANLSRIQGDAAQADRGRRDAIQQQMASRGMGGSGMDMLSQLQSSQAATDRQAQQGLDVAGMAQQRALDAMMKQGAMAGDMRNQDFSQQSRVADARDAAAKFNAANTTQANQFNAGQMNSMGQFNAGHQLQADIYNKDSRQQNKQANASAMNTAGMFNTQGAQGEADRSTQGTNNAQMQNNDVSQSRYQNDVTGDRLKHDMLGEQQAQWNGEADAKRKEKTALVNGVTSMGTSFMKSDRATKHNIKGIKDSSIKEFLKALKPTTYEYKDPSKPGTMPGQRLGLIAQDIKDTELGKDVVSKGEDGNLQVDRDNLMGAMLGALAHLSKGE